MITTTVKKRMLVSLRTKRERLQVFHKSKYGRSVAGIALNENMRLGFFIMVLATVFLAFFSFKLTHAFLSDASASTNNTFSAANVFPTGTLTTTPTPTPISGIANHIVISEVQITGGIGLTDNDFIELYNPTSSAVSLNGMRIVKRDSNDSSDTNIFTFTVSHIIPAHGHYLWGHLTQTNNFATTISADVSSADVLTNDNSIALRNGALNTGAIIDALRWGASTGAPLQEGTEVATGPTAGKSLERKANTSSTPTSMESGADVLGGNGFDSDNNVNDFILRSSSQPQNSSSSIEP